MPLNLQLLHLRCVVAVADHGSFTAAASALGLVQSSLSRAVAEAERRLDLHLFDRTTRRVDVTPDGSEVVEYARRILREFDGGLLEIERFVTGDRGTVTVACLPSIAATLLPPLVQAFRKKHPEVRLVIRDGLRKEVLDALYGGSVDVAIVTVAGPLDGLTQRTLTKDSFYCAMAPTHPLARRKVVQWADFDGEPFIAFGPESSIAEPVLRALAEAGAQPGLITRAQNVGAVAGLAAAGLGVTAVPELVLPMMSFAGLVHVPLVPTVERTIAVLQVERRHQTASTRHFVQSLYDTTS